MNPVELNTIITSISNYLFCNLEEKEFFNLGIFLSLLSKEMLSMEAIRDLCKWQNDRYRHGHDHKRGHGHDHKHGEGEKK